MNDDIQRGRLWGAAAFNNQVITIAGQRLEPDLTKAYLEFKMGHPFHVRPDGKPGGVTGYGTTTSAATFAKSHPSLLHQLVDLGHKVKFYDRSPEQDQIRRDFAMGSIVGVEYPGRPATGWPLALRPDQVPFIRGAAVIHKQLEKVPQMLGEHLGGRHKWSVSLEMKFPHAQSGFIIHQRSKADRHQTAAMAESAKNLGPLTTALNDLDMDYVAVEHAPKDLFACYSKNENRMTKPWDGLPVTFLQGGWDGENHFMGVGIVRYPAEKEAEISQILASDPDALELLADDEDGVLVLKDYFASVVRSLGTVPKIN